MRKNRGTTLLELMVVVAILGILSSLGFASLQRLKANYDLTQATNGLYADLEWVRQKAMGSAHAYGIQFTGNDYTIFEDRDDNKAFDPGEEIKIKNLRNITLSGYPLDPETVIYSRRGTPSNLLTITLTSQQGNTKQILISRFKVRIQ